MRKLLLTLVACGVSAQMSAAYAQQATINLLTSFGAAGSSSKTSAIMAPKLEEILGQPVEIKSSTNIRTAIAAPNDGNTIFVSTIGITALLPSISKSYGVDPLRDLRPVTRLTATPDVLIARAGLGLSNLQELIDYSRENPGTLTYSYIAPTSIHRVECAALLSELGIDAKLDESLRGSEPVMAAIASGALDFAFTTAPYVAPLVEDGSAVPMVVAHSARIPLFPDVPTMFETGISSIPHGSWAGLFVPAGTSDERVARIFAAVQSAMDDPAVIASISELGMEISLSESPDEFTTYLRAEAARLGTAAKKYGIVVD